MDVSPDTADQVGAVQIVDGVLAPGGGDGQVVVQGVVPDVELAAPRVRPFDRLHGPESGIHGEGFGDTERAIERVGVSGESMDVAGYRALSGRFAEHVRVAGVEAFNRGAFI